MGGIETDTMLIVGMFLAMGAGALSFIPLCATNIPSIFIIYNWH